ncbi:sensor histidine kinase [Litorilituus sediminis]|uniref:sensor histidine kinase n=1 Tax=Litorilituus sediminis TaxID=718192 RepID=UPI001FE53249|nr:histidine kinase sensor domain-containing protein [Litorilituus sediminis]
MYLTLGVSALETYLKTLQQREDTWVSVINYQLNKLAGDVIKADYYQGYNFGRSVDWKVHLYFARNPVMEVPFQEGQVSFLIQLPERMRPGSYWRHTRVTMQIILPMILLALLSYLLYRHIMAPLKQLQLATQAFSHGNLKVRVRKLLGSRNDELSELANTFDQMAARIGELIVGQRQLIADLSHELRTPLTRLDIALDNLSSQNENQENIERIKRESKQIRRLVEDTLTLAWLTNEKPKLQQESIDLVDLLDVVIDDAQFEFPQKRIHCQLPNSAQLNNSSHRALGQALENIIRNALRYTSKDKGIKITLKESVQHFEIDIADNGPGVPKEYLSKIFEPFFRVDKSRPAGSDSFGLALAQRQIAAINGEIFAQNRING